MLLIVFMRIIYCNRISPFTLANLQRLLAIERAARLVAQAGAGLAAGAPGPLQRHGAARAPLDAGFARPAGAVRCHPPGMLAALLGRSLCPAGLPHGPRRGTGDGLLLLGGCVRHNLRPPIPILIRMIYWNSRLWLSLHLAAPSREYRIEQEPPDRLRHQFRPLTGLRFGIGHIAGRVVFDGFQP